MLIFSRDLKLCKERLLIMSVLKLTSVSHHCLTCKVKVTVCNESFRFHNQENIFK